MPMTITSARTLQRARVCELGEDAARCLHEELYFGYIGKLVLLGAHAPD